VQNEIICNGTQVNVSWHGIYFLQQQDTSANDKLHYQRLTEYILADSIM